MDSSGDAYVTGYTDSTQATFPVTVGPDLTFNGIRDAFVAKVNAAGTALLYAGYIGGGSDDIGQGIAVDSAGNAYVTGYTDSTQATFPVTVGPDLTENGGVDAFVAKVNAAGTALLYSGYIGGSGSDFGFGIAVDGSGNAYVTGQTDSTQTTFPVTVGPDLTYNGGIDAFVVKVNAAGTALLYAGYIGGNGEEIGSGITVDSSGNAYVTGYTDSTQATFPVTVGPDLTQNGGFDAFVAKISNVVRGDFDGNGSADILWRNIATGENTIWLMNGTNVSSLAALPTIPDQGWQVGGVGDLSGDGKNDIVWRNDFTGQNTIWVMNGAALSSQLPLPPVADLNWKIRAVADFDADGKPDLLWRNISTGQNTVWFMNGPSVTGVAPIPGVSDVNWEIDGAATPPGRAPARLSRQRTTSAVQPVWCDAPRPRPVSPWKYSWKSSRSFQWGSDAKRGSSPKQGRRPDSSGRNGAASRRAISRAASARVTHRPERVGSSTLKVVPVEVVVALERFDEQVVHRETRRARASSSCRRTRRWSIRRGRRRRGAPGRTR